MLCHCESQWGMWWRCCWHEIWILNCTHSRQFFFLSSSRQGFLRAFSRKPPGILSEINRAMKRMHCSISRENWLQERKKSKFESWIVMIMPLQNVFFFSVYFGLQQCFFSWKPSEACQAQISMGLSLSSLISTSHLEDSQPKGWISTHTQTHEMKMDGHASLSRSL